MPAWLTHFWNKCQGYHWKICGKCDQNSPPNSFSVFHGWIFTQLISFVALVNFCRRKDPKKPELTFVCLQVLVAPVVEKGAVQRDIYLPDGGFQWQDSRSAQVFDGGTFLQDYPVPLEHVAVFFRRSWANWRHHLPYPVTVSITLLLLKRTYGLVNMHFSTRDHWSVSSPALRWYVKNVYLHFIDQICFLLLYFVAFSSFTETMCSSDLPLCCFGSGLFCIVSKKKCVFTYSFSTVFNILVAATQWLGGTKTCWLKQSD